MESSTEFGTTYMDVLCTVVPTGTGWAVLPTVSGMQPTLQRIANAAPAQQIVFSVMIQPRLEFGSNLGRASVPVFTSVYVELRRECFVTSRSARASEQGSRVASSRSVRARMRSGVF